MYLNSLKVMKASFVIGFHTARMDNLLQTLRLLSKNHLDVIQESELVLVCQDKCDPVPNDFYSHQHFNLELENMHLPFVTNFGVEKASADKLIILESDRVLPTGYFATVIDQLQEGLQITTRIMKRPQQPLTDEELEGECEFRKERRSEKITLGERNMWSGNTALMKSDYYKAGKMDEFYKGYGWADCDMTLTMEAAGIKSIYRDETEIHLWHEARTYGDGNQKRMFVENGLHFCKKWDRSLPIWFREDVSNYRRGPL